MRPTARRAAAAASRGAGHCAAEDPRYDYGGGRLAALLGVAVDSRRCSLGLATDHPGPGAGRASSGAPRARLAAPPALLPRAIWLALNPISRERPWDAEGVSRATWYRRLKEKRARRVRGASREPSRRRGGVSALLVRQVPAPLYKGEALPSAPARQAGGPPMSAFPCIDPPVTSRLPCLPGRVTSALPPPSGAARGSIWVSFRTQRREPTCGTGCHPCHEHRLQESVVAMSPFIDAHVLAAAAARLDAARPRSAHADRAGSRAAALARGSTSAARCDCVPDDLDRLDPWLRLAPDGRTVVGLARNRLWTTGRAPTKSAIRAQGSPLRSWALPLAPVRDGAAWRRRPAVIPGRDPHFWERGQDGRPERASIMASLLLRDHGFGPVAEATYDVCERAQRAEPISPG
jgi:hypothetical protein